jgi:uncharacterized protein (TIGR02246 family)
VPVTGDPRFNTLKGCSMGPEEQAIHRLEATWIAAVNAGDAQTLLSLMADDVVFLGPGQAPFGREGFGPNFLAAHERAVVHCVSELDEVAVAGAVAFSRSRDSVTVTPRDGSPASRFVGHRLTIYRRQPDGRWLLGHNAHTLTPA